MWDQDLEDASRRKFAWVVAAVVAAAVAAGGWYWYSGRLHPTAEPPPVRPAAPQPAANAAPPIEHPIPGEGSPSALPALNDSDPVVRERLKVVFLPNYNVSLAEAIVPAADLSEQISTAGMEASGTGNMKLALNGALTIGTLDGANIEITERVGAENVVIFGLSADEVADRRRAGTDATAVIAASRELGEVLDAIASGVFSPDDSNRYRALVDSLRHHDHFMVSADFDAYVAAQRSVDTMWRDSEAWWRKAIVNTAHMGWFSADRVILEYAHDIWRARPGI